MTLLPIILIIFISIILLFLIFKDFDMISLRQKTIGVILLLLFGIFIGFYSYKQNQEDKKNFLLQMAFLRGENLKCSGRIINAKDFNLITGTLSFIGKENSTYKNLTYNLSDCTLGDKNSQESQTQLLKD